MITDQNIDELLSKHTSEKRRKQLYEQLVQSPDGMARYAAQKNRDVFAQLPYTVTGAASRHTRPAATWLMRVAVLLLLPLCTYLIYDRMTTPPAERPVPLAEQIAQLQPTRITQYVHNGVKGMVELPDGTCVWLNSGSTLQYPPQFDAAIRAVELTGEAYFKVEADSLHPFCIRCSDGLIVRVTGTEFSLSSYRGEKTQLHLVKGSVDIVQDDRVIARLRPCESFTMQKERFDKQVEPIETVRKSALWKEGYLIFENTPMPEVIKRLERWYGVQIAVEDRTILDYGFTATFRAESLTQVLDMLRISSNIHSRIDGRQVRLM